VSTHTTLGAGENNHHGKSRLAGNRLERRVFLAGGGLLAAGLLGYPLLRRAGGAPQPVFLARSQRYDGSLARTIQNGLEAVGFDFGGVRGQRVLLKPNLVEPHASSPHMTTHPAVIHAAAEVFRRAGAEIRLGEASAHLRDTELVLVESGVDELLRSEKIEFVDLNYAEAQRVPNAARTSRLREFYFPKAVLEADLIVSLPKLKTHHWAGFTCALKNLYGLLPGMIYGWPKNVLHHAGIPETIVDIAASARPTIAIVDAIVCMEGDGPIMGSPKPMGLIAIGLNPTAVDATIARIIGFCPEKVPYLALADGRLGPIAEDAILQRGEPWQALVSPFAILEQPYLQAMRAG